MTPDDLQKMWREESSRTRITIDSAMLSEAVRRSQDRLRIAVYWRDVGEVGTALLLIPIWIFLGIKSSLPWSWYLSIPVFVWIAGFMLIDRWRHPYRATEPGKPLLDCAKASLDQVEHQIWLLRNVFWWYLLPLAVSAMAFFVQTFWQVSDVWWEFAIATGFCAFIVLVIFGVVYRLNQRALRLQLEPRRQELVSLISGLEGTEAEAEPDDIAGLVSSLEEPVLEFRWAENWNLMVPSWRVAGSIVLATCVGGLLGFCFPIPEMGPVFFQSSVGAVILFELALGYVWWRCRKQLYPYSPTQPKPDQPNGIDGPYVSVGMTQQVRVRGPAIAMIFLIFAMTALAFVAIYNFLNYARVRMKTERSVYNQIEDPSQVNVHIASRSTLGD